jgi:TorA maturation chaperone TorD/Pyruvate/2-oxoacid:ferredoxin oxidoreductase delta subunit
MMDVRTARRRSRTYADLARAFSGAKPGLEAEFTRLFLGPGRPAAHPYESVYREGRTLGDTTLDVRRLLAEEGLAPDGRTLPDHVGIELAFMAHLATREALAWEAGDAEGARDYVERQDAFLRDHLLAWLAQFCRRVLVGRPHTHYADLAHRAEGFVSEDAAQVQAWLGLVRPVPSSGEGSNVEGNGGGAVVDTAEQEQWSVTVGQGCTLCEICTQVCRPGALRLVRDGERETISLHFAPSFCDGCAACQRWCPEHGIYVEQVTSGKQQETNLVIRDLQLATSRILACSRCGQPYVPEAMVARVQARVGGIDAALLQRLTLCHNCKVTDILPRRCNISSSKVTQHVVIKDDEIRNTHRSTR